MGIEITNAEFSEEDSQRFSKRLASQLTRLQEIAAAPGFGEGPSSMGAELEVAIIDDSGAALALDIDELVSDLDPHVTLEINRFNLEYNLDPTPTAGPAFSLLEEQLRTAQSTLDAHVAAQGGQALPIGILPTIRSEDLGDHAMTPRARYRALDLAIRKRLGRALSFRIDGKEPLSHQSDTVTTEGASTSLQLHLRVAPEDFADFYNAGQVATALTMAVAANSPFFLGHELWDETRIAVFKQSTDTRSDDELSWRAPSRVSFGHGWIRESATELFRESIALFPPLLPVCAHEGQADEEQDRRLEELRLHHGTIWRWNRAIYDHHNEGHFRIEFRALPSGPTPVDMAANAAFLIGLTAGLAEHIGRWLPSLPFSAAERNFYRASKYGLQAELLWPDAKLFQLRPRSAAELIAEHLEVARHGLSLLQVASSDADRYLGIIESRLAAKRNPAGWLRSRRQELRDRKDSDARRADLDLVREYAEHSGSNQPSHTWPLGAG